MRERLVSLAAAKCHYLSERRTPNHYNTPAETAMSFKTWPTLSTASRSTPPPPPFTKTAAAGDLTLLHQLSPGQTVRTQNTGILVHKNFWNAERRAMAQACWHPRTAERCIE